MAALQLASAAAPKALSWSLAPRILTPYLRPKWSIPCEPSSSNPQLHNTPSNSPSLLVPRSPGVLAGWISLIPSLESLLELIPPILLAAPKKKTSHRKKMQKLAGTGLKNKTNLNCCPACGNIQLINHLCPNCFGAINRAWKEERRTVIIPEEPEETVETMDVAETVERRQA